MEDNFTPELIEKARQANSPEELLSLAKENNIELSEDKAKEYFERLNKSGELADEELNNVSGGGCNIKKGGKKYTVVTKWCECFTGQHDINTLTNGKFKRDDNHSLRKIWWNFSVGRYNHCGTCTHLAFKGGTGYCDLSGR